MIQGYVPKNEDSLINNIIELDNLSVENITDTSELENILEDIYCQNIILNSPITQGSLAALKQRYKDLGKNPGTSKDDIPYDIDGSIIEIDDGKIDSDYMNKRFVKFLKVLRQENYNKEEFERVLNELHKSFASLSQTKQKYANILIHDLENGDIAIEENKTFMDYITEYETKIENDQIKKISNLFGLDESKLRNIMSSLITENNINEYGRFDDLVKTVNIEKAQESLEKIYNKNLKIYEVSMEVHEILRKFILLGGFDLTELENNSTD